MRRRSWGLILFLFSFSAFAAPAPKPFKTGWDKPIDPDHDCKIIIKDGTVTMELPGTDHNFVPKRGQFNAPRLLRDAVGDFVMQVRVSGSFHPSAKSTVDKEDPSVAAGLLLIPADDNCIRLEYESYRPKGEQRTCPAFRMRGEQIFNMQMDLAVPWKPNPAAEKEAHIYLRLERRGNFIHPFLSPDGEKWTYSGFNVEVPDLPRKVKVGLAAYSTSTEPFKVRFDQFKLTRGQKKSK